MFALPWDVPPIEGLRALAGWPAGSTAVPPQIDPESTATYDNDFNGPSLEAPPAPTPPTVGRPHRGDRAKVKAARRQRRTSH